MEKKTVAVIFGGASSEHEVSLRSVVSVLQNIPRDRYNTVTVGITKNGRWLYYDGELEGISDGSWKERGATAFLSPDSGIHGLVVLQDGGYKIIRVDAVFPVLHGKNGEDGTIQGLLEMAGIPFVGCDCLASAACMDKCVTHTILDNAQIPTARWCEVRKNQMGDFPEVEQKIRKKLGYPVFVKPANAGSSVGVSKARSFGELEEALKLAFQHDRKAVVEETIVGKEVECAVLGNGDPFASVIGEIEPVRELYDYEGKYLDGSTNLYIPARIPEEVAEEIRRIAVKAYRAIGCEGFSRVDFFARADGSIILNEINTIPGFTSISMYPKLMEASGVPYPELIDRLIRLGIQRAEEQ